MRILVTGGAGYIGTHTTRELLAQGHRVVVIDLDLIPAHAGLDGATSVVADIRDRDRVTEVLRSEAIEGVIHFAGRKFVAEAMRDPGLYFDVNTGGSLSVLRAMVDAGTPAIVFSSSCTVYGTPPSNPATEEMPTHPENPYGASKLFVEQMLGWFGRVHGIRSMSLRYFNAAGASFDGRLGERADRTLMLIPMLMLAALGRREPVDIYGTDYPTPDGTAIRDYIHVEDLAEAHAVALDWARAHEGAHVLNLGTGVGSSVREVISLVEEVSDGTVPVRWADRRAGDAVAVWADPGNAAQVLGWRARHDLRAMIESAWAWHSMHEDRARRG